MNEVFTSYRVSYAATLVLAILAYVLTALIAAAAVYGFDLRTVTTLGIALGVVAILKDWTPRVNRPPDPARKGKD